MPRRPLLSSAVALIATVALAGVPLVGCAQSVEPDVPFEPTPQRGVTRMLEMADVGPDDIVYDLGSGDGRIPITAVRDFDARKAVGVEIQPHLVRRSRENVREAGVADRVEIVRGDLFEVDFSEASVVTLYLWPRVNIRLRPKLLSELAPGTRVVSYSHDMDEWEPDRTDMAAGYRVYVWTIPADVEGVWQWRAAGRPYRLQLDQQFQEVSGTLRAFGETVPIEDARLHGRNLSFSAKIDGRSVQFEGQVTDSAKLEGSLSVAGTDREVVATRAD